MSSPREFGMRARAAKVRGFLREHQHDGEFVARCDHAAASDPHLVDEYLKVMTSATALVATFLLTLILTPLTAISSLAR